MGDIKEPLQANEARKLVSEILGKGRTTFTGHAYGAMADDGMVENDVTNVLKGGKIHEPAELKSGSWRYRLHTVKFCVVVVFRSAWELVVVTCWRKK